MESTSAGELVKVATAGPLLDAIVFDTPSAHKAVVALVDRGRGPVFRTVNVNTLSERAEHRRMSRLSWNFGGGLLSELSQTAVAATSGAVVSMAV